MMKIKSALLVATTAAGLFASAPASALNIILRADSSFLTQPNGAQALYAFQKAANYWNQTITTNVTLTFDVHFGPLSPGVLGGTYSNTYDTSVAQVYNRLNLTQASALDATAVANLRPLTSAGGLGYRGPGTDPNTGLLTTTTAGSSYDNNNSYNNLFLNANTTVDKALGINVDYDNSLFKLINDYYAANPDPSFRPFRTDADGDITFSSAFAFDFDPTDGISVGTYDFTGVAVHEMGHALGFVSGLDDYDYSYVGASTKAQVDNTSVLTVLDLYRYGTNSFGADGQRQLQLDPNRGAFFSIDGNTPFNLANGLAASFATGANWGDGAQGSHWKDAQSFLSGPNGCVVDINPLGIMDPTIGACVLDHVSSNDLAAFDAIGYNLGTDVLKNPGYKFDTKQMFDLDGLATVQSVPEPATWGLMILGFGMVGGALRRRRAATKVSFAI